MIRLVVDLQDAFFVAELDRVHATSCLAAIIKYLDVSEHDVDFHFLWPHV